ncbi:MAG TPA: UPF0158 family protein [Spirochaetota bacterium]|nr:UPF0158 family protein [Spirochaetota bacterium]
MKLKIDPDDLIFALEDNNVFSEYYLDLQNGNVFQLFEDEFEEDVEGYSHNLVGRYPDRFLFIEPIESREAFNIMGMFVSTINDDFVRERLGSALSGRKPFRNFKDALLDFPEIRERWFEFQYEELKKCAITWLQVEGIEPEFRRKSV